jgi:hypothetical protein
MIYYADLHLAELPSTGIPAGTVGDIQLIAVWDPTPILYHITYDLNGGINSPGNPTEYAVTCIFPIIINNPYMSDHIFMGWMVEYADGSTAGPVFGVDVIPAGTLGNLILRAVWKVPISITYHPNGLSGEPTTRYADSNDEIVIEDLLGVGFENSALGFFFFCCYTNADGSGTKYDPGQKYVIEESMTLYARWGIAN